MPCNTPPPPLGPQHPQEEMRNTSCTGVMDNIFGSQRGEKSDSMFRVAATNFGCLPPTQDDYKHTAFIQHVRSMDADVYGMSEVGRNWSKTGRKHQWSNRMKNEFENLRTTLAWNKNDPSGTSSQWGGTGLMTIGRMVTAVFENGVDPVSYTHLRAHET